jgi:TolB-like protein/Tfp pilus assembly protein PilF
MPFVHMSAASDNEYFCDGLADELITALTKIDGLKVAARSSSFAFKGRNLEAGEVARALNVATILEGSVRRSGNRLRITVQLVNAADGYDLWSERYDREIKDIFAVQDEITLAVVDALKLKMLGAQKDAMLKRYTHDSAAYEAYLKGRFHWHKRTLDGLNRSADCFKAALELDPEYSLAYAGLADSYAVLGIAEYGILPPREAMPKAKAAALKALEIDSSLAEAQSTLAHVRAFFEWDWAGAERDFQRAIELNPNYPLSHHWYALFLAAMGRHDEAIDAENQAQQIEPLSLIINKNVGTILYYAGRVEPSIEQYRKTLELDMNFARTHLYLGVAYLRQGRFDEAVHEYEEAIRTSGGGTVPNSLLAYAHAQAGKRDEANEILNNLKERQQREYVPAFNIALIYAGLGKVDEAFAWLEKAFEERSSWLVSLRIEPLLEPLRSDRRFEDLAQRVGLP